MQIANSIRFIVNPRAGGKDRSHEISSAVKALFTSRDGYFEVKKSGGVGDAERLAEEARRKGFAGVVACGGDGTVREIAAPLINSGLTLGIAPLGRANVIAGGLGMSLDPMEALRPVADGKSKMIDVGTISGRRFYTSAGIGFDVVLAKNFKYWPQSKKRFKSFLSKELIEFKRFKFDPLVVKDEKKFTHVLPMLVRFANVERYGDSLLISKGADPADGFLDVTIIPMVKLKEVVRFMPSLISGDMDKVPGAKKLRISEPLFVERNEKGPLHADGEVFVGERKFSISIEKGALSLWIP